MEPRSLAFVTAACFGRLRRGVPDASVRQVTIDSRRVASGDLFFALPGGSFDGHDYVVDAARAGAAAVVVETGRVDLSTLPEGCGVIEVDVTRRALGRLAARYRSSFAAPTIAVAGSNGKTTTKELLAAAIGSSRSCLANEASFNNDIGVPLTLLRMGSQHAAAVVEVGSNHPGELGPLLELAQPRIGVLTSIGREHLEFFGGLDGVVEEEGTLAEKLPEHGCLVTNGDIAGLDRVLSRCAARVVRVGWAAGNSWRVVSARVTSTGTWFDLETPVPGYSGSYQISLLGRHQALNAALAAAVCAELGLDPVRVREGLRGCKPARMRMEAVEVSGLWVLDDSYNANADSMIAGLDVLRGFPCTGRRVAVLGDMAELGAASRACHQDVGEASANGIDLLVGVGPESVAMVESRRRLGGDAVQFHDADGAIAWLTGVVASGDVVLVKGSRSMRMERVAQALKPVPGAPVQRHRTY